jgi:hypothetical protein
MGHRLKRAVLDIARGTSSVVTGVEDIMSA